MSQQYGITLGWSVVGAPKPCGCILESFTYRGTGGKHEEPDEAGDMGVVVLHGPTGNVSFGGTISDESTDLPDLSSGALITITDSPDITGGIVLCSQLDEEWAIGSPKKFTGSATHFPDCVQGGGAAAGSLNGFTPSQTPPIIRPAGKLIWGTGGMTSSLGTVQRVRMSQVLKLQPEPNGIGAITFVSAVEYMRKVSVDILCLANAVRPARGALLSLTGAPSHMSGVRVEDSEMKWQRGKVKMITVETFWFPGMD